MNAGASIDSKKMNGCSDFISCISRIQLVLILMVEERYEEVYSLTLNERKWFHLDN